MAWNHVFLENKFILYGMGVSNKEVEKFFKANNVFYLIVTDDLEINDSYIIIKSPGIDNNTPFLIRCRKLNLLIINDIELFYLLRPNLKYIGITGTCGKTTTCTVLYNIMNKIFNVRLCGNIGIPIFKYIDEDIEYLIVELSSYQLEYINKFKVSYYIILNIYSHHLNHHLNFNNYLSAKLKLINNLLCDDVLIINDKISLYLSGWDNKSKVFTFSNSLKASAYYDDNNLYYKTHQLSIENIEYFKYHFNKENFLSLFILLKELNINNDVIKDNLMKFDNLPHRMEKIFESKSLIIINDSKSTGFLSLKEAINYTLKSYKDYKLTLILGGKLDIEELRNNIKLINSLRQYQIYCYGENKKILSKLLNINYYKDLDDIINNIDLSNKKAILFSPAAQSFDEFKSYEDRGEQFKKLILKRLKA